MTSPPHPIGPASFPGGCYLLFNSLINWEASEKLVAAVLNARNAGFREVTVCIHSAGGVLENAFYALNALRALPIRVRMHNAGSIKSAGNVLFMAGDERTASAASTFFFHETWFDFSGQQSSSSVDRRLESLQKDDSRSVAMVAKSVGQSEEVVRDWFLKDRTLDAFEAVELGVAHSIAELVIPPDAYIERIIVG